MLCFILGTVVDWTVIYSQGCHSWDWPLFPGLVLPQYQWYC